MDEATIQIHIKRGLVHVIRCAIFGVAWVILSWLFGMMGMIGALLYGIVYLPFVVGGLVFCWRDIAPGWDKGLMAGALYGIVLILLKIIFEGLIGFGSVPLISASIGGIDYGSLLGGFGFSWWGLHFGWPGIWPSFLGLIAFGGAFSYIKDFIIGKIKIDSPV